MRRGTPGAGPDAPLSLAQVPRTEGREKGKGSYWTFAGGCESLLDLFENGNYRRRRRRRGPKREGPRGASAGGAQGPPAPPEPARAQGSPALGRQPPAPAGPAALGTGAHNDVKFSIDYILSSPHPFPELRSLPHRQEAQQTNLHFWTM